ncbi:MAG: LPS export ABC transporter permease LptF [Deltaproteobacteria bacterium]
MKVTHRYFLAEIAGPYLISLFTFSLVVLLQRFSRLADLVVAKGVPALWVGKMLLALVPTFLQITLPAALLLAILLALGRMSSDSEVVALRTAGVGMRGLLLPVLLLGSATCLASLWIGWSGIPWGQRTLESSVAGIISLRAGAAAEEHVFREIAPGVLLYPDRVSADGTRMTGVLLAQRVEEQDPVVVFAEEGTFLPEDPGTPLGIVLSAGTIHQEDRAAGLYRLGDFATMEFRLPRETAGSGGGDSPRHLTLPELWDRIVETGGTGRSATYRYHFHRRLSLAASCLAFGLLAIPLGVSQRARGKSPALALTLFVILVYYLFLAAGGAVESTVPGAMVSLLWAPNLLGATVAAWILVRSERRLILLPNLFDRLRGRR